MTLTLEDGGTQTIDLTGFVSTDDQALSLSGNTLTLEDGGTVDLTPYMDNTDDQQITDFSLSGNIVTLTLEDGGTQTIDLSGFVSSDDQALEPDVVRIYIGRWRELSIFLIGGYRRPGFEPERQYSDVRGRGHGRPDALPGQYR